MISDEAPGKTLPEQRKLRLGKKTKKNELMLLQTVVVHSYSGCRFERLHFDGNQQNLVFPLRSFLHGGDEELLLSQQSHWLKAYMVSEDRFSKEEHIDVIPEVSQKLVRLQ